MNRRVPIYPEDLFRFPEALRNQMVFETNYGSDYATLMSIL